MNGPASGAAIEGEQEAADLLQKMAHNRVHGEASNQICRLFQENGIKARTTVLGGNAEVGLQLSSDVFPDDGQQLPAQGNLKINPEM